MNLATFSRRSTSQHPNLLTNFDSEINKYFNLKEHEYSVRKQIRSTPKKESYAIRERR